MSHDGGCGRHGGAHEMRAAALALAPFEVAVRSGGAAIPRADAVGIHREAHGAARFPPFKPRGFEDHVKPLAFGLQAHEPRARDHQSLFDVGCKTPPEFLHDGGRRPQVFDASIGAGADEDVVRRNVRDLRARGEAHVLKRPYPAFFFDGIR